MDFSRLSEIHECATKAMVGWMVRYVEADGSWEFTICSIAPSEQWSYDGDFDLGVKATVDYLRSLL